MVVSVSRHDPRKGIEVLLRALAELCRDAVPFRAIVLGPGTLLEAHRRLARRLGLDGAVSMPGRVDDVGPYLKTADVYVLPSLAEASGSVSVLEALQAGIAVVASACDGLPEDLTDGRDALLVPPGDAAALATALRTAVADDALRSRLAAAGRRRYEERFSAQGLIDALAAVYAELGVVTPRAAAHLPSAALGERK